MKSAASTPILYYCAPTMQRAVAFGEVKVTWSVGMGSAK